MVDKYGKYIELAKRHGMLDAIIIPSSDICFDIRANLKCCWGCDRQATADARCDSRGTTLDERIQMVKQYTAVLLLHSHNAQHLSEVILELEREAFLDGYYFAFALRTCNLCGECLLAKGEECPQPKKVRPCDSLFGIDVYRTVRKFKLPCRVLQSKNDTQDRYGFLLIE